STDAARGVELGLRRLLRLVVARARDAAAGRGVPPRVSPASGGAPTPVCGAGRGGHEVGRAAGTEPRLTDCLDSSHLLALVLDARVHWKILGDRVVQDYVRSEP